ncbi:MAG: GNAT family N-acetyltransferase, partial [Clostridia bacterium]|nr:GNAT family N-acetyltransferase [Clostridia bacterium]
IARQRGELHTIVSVITSGNDASVALHKKFGFTYCGTIREVGSKFGRMLDIQNYQLIL